MDGHLPGSSVHGILQARILQWVAIPLSRAFSWPRNLTQVSWFVGRFSGFPYFLQFKSEFCNKEFMIWATVSSWSCFCCLYRASPSLTANNIINLIQYWASGDVHVYRHPLCCWKKVFAMTSAFSWQNSVSLCPGSFCTPRPITILFSISLILSFWKCYINGII